MKTYASFYDIVEGVKQETGITNLVNKYNEIVKLIVRAERDINPFSGHFIKKTVKYTKGSTNFSGTAIKTPSDLVEIIKVYDKHEYTRKPISSKFSNTQSHILLCNNTVNPVAVLSYWAMQMNGEGYPFVPYTHFEAVVSFIVWKFYSQRAFQDAGAQNAKMIYQNNYENFAKAAKGSDFFPTDENLEGIRAQQITQKFLEITCQDDCFCSCSLIDDDSPENPNPDPEPNPNPTNNMKIKYWQENSIVQEIFPEDVTTEFLSDKQSISYAQFLAGVYFTASYVGRYGLAIENGPSTPDSIVDILGASIKDSVNYQYYADKKLLVIISKNFITPGSFLLKLT